ncbi:cytoskeletal protein RodZ [Agromyces flavus]|uniref:Cytoskeletal protein RodZ n=1 Tax=Agromyces flavus TaxID=589382 RepID=A0A1H1LFF1_9MICO|nr:hypothetical protein [Agromyces flavus]MCP2367553.1 cytoskeletal protein RodZ [Agromyces flavus]GGI45500.1 hypothetical protein GCM10010932_09860 [Agromyces flavus]SDR73233.1 hypothetical protein SAMN04489721_0120 [Agromyces flavus]
MTSNRPASGRLPASVYRRRRLMVLLGLVAVIVAIVLVIVRPGASQGDEVSQTTPPSSTPAPVASGAPSSEPPATDAPATDEPVVSEAPAVDGAACTEDQITVEALTDKAVYAAGEQPKLSVTITNTGPNTCALNVGTKAQVFTVTSGKEVYWTSTDCQTEPVDAEVSLAPDTPVSSTAPITWDRTRSTADTCAGTRAPVPAGGASYHLSVSVSGFESAETKQFLLY